MSTEVAEKIAAHRGVDPWELEVPLHEVVDADALNALMDGHERPARGNVHVEFLYNGYKVIVDETRKVTVDEVG